MLKGTNLLKIYMVYILLLKPVYSCWSAFYKSILKGSSEINFQIFCIVFTLFSLISSLKILGDEDFLNSKPNLQKPLTDKYFYKYLIILLLFISTFFAGKFNKIFGIPRIYHFGMQDFMFVFIYAFMILYKPKDKIEINQS